MSKSAFPQILRRYAELEREVQLLIGSRCGTVCELCSSCCCRADICEEAFESPFLKKLHGQGADSTSFSDRYGWLTERGCGLAIGRPPVCYEFFCDELLASQPDEIHRYVLRTLGALVAFVGRNALGHTHLVEITNETDLERLSFEHIKGRLQQAGTALEHIRSFYDNGILDPGALEQFRPILHLPAELNE